MEHLVSMETIWLLADCPFHMTSNYETNFPLALPAFQIEHKYRVAYATVFLAKSILICIAYW